MLDAIKNSDTLLPDLQHPKKVTLFTCILFGKGLKIDQNVVPGAVATSHSRLG